MGDQGGGGGKTTLWFLQLKGMWIMSQPPSTCKTASSYRVNNTNTFIIGDHTGSTLPNPGFVGLSLPCSDWCAVWPLRGKHHGHLLSEISPKLVGEREKQDSLWSPVCTYLLSWSCPSLSGLGRAASVCCQWIIFSAFVLESPLPWLSSSVGTL